MKFILRCVMCLGLLLVGAVSAQFDPVRPIPADALKAEMIVTGERLLNLNGTEFLLSPGGQVFNQQNRITLLQALGSDTYVVRVKFNQQGEAHRVWILTAAENAVDAPKLKPKDSSWWRLF